MADNSKKRTKWHINLFDVIIILIALIAAFAIYSISGSGGKIISSGTQEKIKYTIELNGMVGDTALSVKPGDPLTDRIERRAIGSVSAVEVTPFRPLVKNNFTGELIITEYPFDERKTAIVTIEADATVTDKEISVGGFRVRVGTAVSVIGPLYSGSGFIVDIERN